MFGIRFPYGRLRYVKVPRAQYQTRQYGKGPPQGKRWLILGGIVYHVNGSDTYMIVTRKVYNKQQIDFSEIADSSEVTGKYPLFNTRASVTHHQWVPIILEYGDWINCTGSTGAYLNLLVWEWDE